MLGVYFWGWVRMSEVRMLLKDRYSIVSLLVVTASIVLKKALIGPEEEANV
jgi:hypothetical protein